MSNEKTNLEPLEQGADKRSIWDSTITLRKIRNYLLLAFVVATVWYVWQYFKLEWHSKMGGLLAQNSPYYAEIPDNCKKFSNRHRWHTELPDSLALRIRPIRLDSHYLQPQYGRIRCLGYAVLTGVHMSDPLDANFTDTYTDTQGNPIVRITVEYFQPYAYNPTQRTPLTEEERQ